MSAEIPTDIIQKLHPYGIDEDGWVSRQCVLEVPPLGPAIGLVLELEIPEWAGLDSQTMSVIIDGKDLEAQQMTPGYHSMHVACADHTRTFFFTFVSEFRLPGEERMRSAYLSAGAWVHCDDSKPFRLVARKMYANERDEVSITPSALNDTSRTRQGFCRNLIKRMVSWSELTLGKKRLYWRMRWTLAWHIDEFGRKLKWRDRRVLGTYRKILVIRMNHSYSGFFCYFVNVINQLRYADAMGLYPVVDFGRWSGDGPNAYYDPHYGSNMWDYFFEPVADFSYRQIQQKVRDSHSEIRRDDIVTLTSDNVWYLHLYCPKSLYSFAYGLNKDIQQNAEFAKHQREKAHELMEKYIRVKPEIQQIVDAFMARHMTGQPVLGIHLRGTDKGFQDENKELLKILGPEQYREHIDAYLEEHPTAKIFVATDQVQFLDEMKETYGDRVLFREALRSTDDSAVFGGRNIDNSLAMDNGNDYFSNYHKGEEVLVDCLLLSRCDYLLRCSSHVSGTATWFNPKLPGVDMNVLYR